MPTSTLPRDPEPAPCEDFPALRQQALGWLEQWCQDNWTDFNESDPGVTLLEELCYALTDLGLRAGLPVTDLLQVADGTMPWRENSLHPPVGSFPMEPLTPQDYRVLILDRWPAILAARCEPLRDAHPAGFTPPPVFTAFPSSPTPTSCPRSPGRGCSRKSVPG